MLVINDVLGESIYMNFFAKCTAGRAIGPFEGFTATRNPVNRDTPFKAWLVPVNAESIPECLPIKLAN